MTSKRGERKEGWSGFMLFVVWGVLLIVIIAALVLLQGNGLSRMLTADSPDKPHACYYKKGDGTGGCARAGSTDTPKDCDEQRGSGHSYYFIENHQCLKAGSYRLTPNSSAKYCDGRRDTIDKMWSKCVDDLQDQIEKAKACPKGKEVGFWGVPYYGEDTRVCDKIPQSVGPIPIESGERCWSDGIYTKRVYAGLAFRDSWYCNVTCSILWGCVGGGESPGPRVSIGDDLDISEGGGLGNGIFRLTVHDKDKKSVSDHGGIDVTYSTADGTATGDEDYEKVSGGTVKIPDKSSSETVNVRIKTDNDVEGNENFFVQLNSAVSPKGSVMLGRSRGEGVIIDDDSRPSDSPSPLPKSGFGDDEEEEDD